MAIAKLSVWRGDKTQGEFKDVKRVLDQSAYVGVVHDNRRRCLTKRGHELFIAQEFFDLVFAKVRQILGSTMFHKSQRPIAIRLFRLLIALPL